MELRRVQVTGGSSYVITLPKEWVRAMKIEKNEPVYVGVQPDGTLMVAPHTSKQAEHQVKTIDVDSIGEPEFLLRVLIGAYIAGHNTIRLESERGIPPSLRNVASEFTKMTIGQEIVDETDRSIVLKDLVNPLEMPIENSIKRMYLIVREMLIDGMEGLKRGDEAMMKEVMQRDREVDRLHWLVARQLHLVMRELGLMEGMRLTMRDAFNLYVVSRILERVGDHGERIAGFLLNISMRSRLDEALVAELVTAMEKALNILDAAMRALFSRSATEANEVIKARQELRELTEDIEDRVIQRRGSIAIPVGYVVESIRRAGEYGVDIAEIVINRSMEYPSQR